MALLVRMIHGEPVRLTTECPVIAAAALELLDDFAGEVVPAGEPLEIALHAVADPHEFPVAVPASATPLDAQLPHLDYRLYRAGSRWLAEFTGDGLMCFDPGAGRVDGWLIRPEDQAPDLIESYLRLAVIEMLRLRGIHAIHAAGLEAGGRGFLIAGPSGRGKTTSCLALVRDGFRCLSDDHPLLRATAGGLELLPFPGRVDVTGQTVAMFSELDAAQDRLRDGSVKRSFQLTSVYAGSLAAPCSPSFLIFPRIVDWPQSHLEPLARSRALEELLPETMLVLEPDRARRQFEICTQLVRTAKCYRLYFGRDVDALPRLFESLLTEPIAA